LTHTADLDLGSYAHPLPAGLTQTGRLYLRSYAHPLPAGLLERFRADLFDVLDSAPDEVPGLLQAVRDGRIDGSTYSGECCCLVGTLEKSGRTAIPHDSSRPAEQWFLAINKGDIPATNPSAAQAEAWIQEWIVR